MSASNGAQHSALFQRRLARWNLQLKIAGIIIILLSAFGIVGAIDKSAEEATAAQVHEHMQRLAAARELERGFRKCPPPGEGMTDVVVMIVKYTADANPSVERCLRFAERSYIPKKEGSSSLIPHPSSLARGNQ